MKNVTFLFSFIFVLLNLAVQAQSNSSNLKATEATVNRASIHFHPSKKSQLVFVSEEGFTNRSTTHYHPSFSVSSTVLSINSQTDFASTDTDLVKSSTRLNIHDHPAKETSVKLVNEAAVSKNVYTKN